MSQLSKSGTGTAFAPTVQRPSLDVTAQNSQYGHPGFGHTGTRLAGQHDIAPAILYASSFGPLFRGDTTSTAANHLHGECKLCMLRIGKLLHDAASRTRRARAQSKMSGILYRVIWRPRRRRCRGPSPPCSDGGPSALLTFCSVRKKRRPPGTWLPWSVSLSYYSDQHALRSNHAGGPHSMYGLDAYEFSCASRRVYIK